MIHAESKKRFNALLDGFVLVGAEISGKDSIVFILKSIGGAKGYLEDGLMLPTRLVYYDPRKNVEKHGIGAREWEQGVKKGWAAFSEGDASTIVACNDMALTYEISSDMLESKPWRQIPKPNNSAPMLRTITGLKLIDNDAYMFGLFRKLYKRVGAQEWKDLSYEEEHTNLHSDLEELLRKSTPSRDLGTGFNAVDGFNQNDIYACGDRGDCWHYNGEEWRRLDIPIDKNITAVLCANNGYVYMGLNNGDIIRGRYIAGESQNWEILQGIGSEVNSLAWFQGEVYIGSDDGLYVIKGKLKIQQYQFPENGWRQYSYKHVNSCGEALLSYGNDQALIFDGLQWEEIVGTAKQ